MLIDLFSFLVLLSAVPAGLMVGLLPAVGAVLLMTTFYSVLLHVDPTVSLCFYVIALTAAQFSGSVSAICFGLIGEATSLPAVRERDTIVRHNSEMVALKFTALGSVLGAIIGVVVLGFAFYLSVTTHWIFRTEFLLALLVSIILGAVFWPYNKWYYNIALAVLGYIVGSIGYDPLTRTEFLTFGSDYLYGGIPTSASTLGLYAIPLVYKLFLDRNNLVRIGPISLNKEKSVESFPIWSSIRGSAVGVLAGIVPAVGTSVSSNVAHFIETKIFAAATNIANSVATAVDYGCSGVRRIH